MRIRQASITLLTGIALTGCAASPTPPNTDHVATEVQQRIGREVHWRNPGSNEDQAIQNHVHDLLTHDLTLDDTVEIALLSNPRIQAAFEEVGIAQADLLQSGLLSNPRLDAAIKFPDTAPRGSKIDLGLSTNVVELFLLPVRKRLAGMEVTKAEQQAGQTILDLTRDVKVAYYNLSSAMQTATLEDQSAEAANVAADLAQRQHDAGNIPEITLRSQQVSALDADLHRQRTQSQLRIRHIELQRLMGLPTSNWKIFAGLPPTHGVLKDLPSLEKLASENRLDLLASRQQEALATQQAKLAGVTGLTDTRIGAAYERETDGQNMLGPSIDLELPIFDQGQAKKAHAMATLRLARRRTEELSLSAREEIDRAAESAESARYLADKYDAVLLPLRKKQVDLARRQYNAMQAPADEWLAVRRDELTAQIAATEARRNYWIAIAELEKAVGKQLSSEDFHPQTQTTQPAGGTKP